MKQYQNYLNEILFKGKPKGDRTGTGTISRFGCQMRFDLSEGFPLITTKKLHFKSIAYELLWFLKGDTNTKFLNENGVKIWDEWSLKDDYIKEINGSNILKARKGDLGPIYGKQWTNWENNNFSVNQITQLIQQLKQKPDSRRHIISAWNVTDLPDEDLSAQENVKLGNMALAPCHTMFQFYTEELDLIEKMRVYYDLYNNNVINVNHEFFDSHNIPKRRLSCQLYQRSADSFLGVPYNIASYSLLMSMIAQQVNMIPGEFIWTGGDCHIYTNHLEQVKEILKREPYPLPKLKILRKPDSIFDYKYEDFELIDYKAHPHIKGDVAI